MVVAFQLLEYQMIWWGCTFEGNWTQGCPSPGMLASAPTLLVVALVITAMGGGDGLKASENVNNPPHTGTDQHSWLALTGEKFLLLQICLESPQCSSLP